MLRSKLMMADDDDRANVEDWKESDNEMASADDVSLNSASRDSSDDEANSSDDEANSSDSGPISVVENLIKQGQGRTKNGGKMNKIFEKMDQILGDVDPGKFKYNDLAPSRSAHIYGASGAASEKINGFENDYKLRRIFTDTSHRAFSADITAPEEADEEHQAPTTGLGRFIKKRKKRGKSDSGKSRKGRNKSKNKGNKNYPRKKGKDRPGNDGNDQGSADEGSAYSDHDESDGEDSGDANESSADDDIYCEPGKGQTCYKLSFNDNAGSAESGRDDAQESDFSDDDIIDGNKNRSCFDVYCMAREEIMGPDSDNDLPSQEVSLRVDPDENNYENNEKDDDKSLFPAKNDKGRSASTASKYYKPNAVHVIKGNEEDSEPAEGLKKYMEIVDED